MKDQTNLVLNAAAEYFSGESLARLAPTVVPGSEQYVQSVLTALEIAGVRYVAEDHDRRILISRPGLPRVEYFPAKNRWRTAANSKKVHGDVGQFLAWLKESAS